MNNKLYLLILGLVACPFITIQPKTPVPVKNLTFAKELPKSATTKQEPITANDLEKQKQKIKTLKKQLKNLLKKYPKFQDVKKQYDDAKIPVKNAQDKISQLYAKNLTLFNEYNKAKEQKKVPKDLQNQINAFSKKSSELSIQYNTAANSLIKLKTNMRKTKEALIAKETPLKKIGQQLDQAKKEFQDMQHKPIKK